MQIEYDQEANAVYLSVFEGVHDHTVEVEPMKIYVDVDAEGRTMGIEFLSLESFERYIEAHGGLNLPEQFAGPQSLIPA